MRGRTLIHDRRRNIFDSLEFDAERLLPPSSHLVSPSTHPHNTRGSSWPPTFIPAVSISPIDSHRSQLSTFPRCLSSCSSSHSWGSTLDQSTLSLSEIRLWLGRWLRYETCFTALRRCIRQSQNGASTTCQT